MTRYAASSGLSRTGCLCLQLNGGQCRGRGVAVVGVVSMCRMKWPLGQNLTGPMVLWILDLQV